MNFMTKVGKFVKRVKTRWVYIFLYRIRGVIFVKKGKERIIIRSFSIVAS